MTTREVFAKYTTPETFEKIKEYDSVSQMWQSVHAEYGNREAISFMGNSYSFTQLELDASKMRAILKSKGLVKGDTVALYAANSYDFVKSFIAIVTYGCVAAVLPAHLDEMSVMGCCMGFKAKALVYLDSLEEKTAVARSKLPQIAFIKTSETENESGSVPCSEVSASDTCVIMFTGGTTGKSKGVVLSNQAFMQGVVNGCYGIKEIFFQKYILVLPLSHVFGLIRNLMTSLYTGSSMLICTNNKDMFKDIAMFSPTILVLVPALVEMALNLSKQFGKNMLGTTKTIICGAATVSPYLVDECKKFGITLLPGYGLTESANLVTGNPESERKPDSIGLPYPNMEIKIVDGELWLKGKNMLTCYAGNEEANKESFSDGWFKTGDLVRIDEEGFMYITGRIKEVIILSNGENVSPAEVEAHYNTISVIQDCQLYENTDHVLALEIVPRAVELKRLGIEDAEKYILEQVELVTKTLPGFQQPAKVIIRDKDFDRSPSMKIIRYKNAQ